MTDSPKISSVGVKNLRAQFERSASARKALTPEQFLREQKEAAEREATAILLARKKAAAFNMAMRQLELKSAAETKMTPQQEEKRAKLRQEARRLSVALRTMDNTGEENRPEVQKQERRATHLLLASMASELEEEMKREELDAIREEEEAKERAAAAAELAAREKEEEEERKRREEQLRMAHEMAEIARKQVEEDERQRKKEEEEAEAKRKKQQAEAEAELKRQESMRIQQLEEKDRQVLTAYLRENYPEKLGEVETLLKQFAGNLDVLFEELGKDQKFQEMSSKNNESSILEVASDDDDDGDDESSSIGKRGQSEGAETAVHTFRDDETIAPKARNDKSFLKPGVDLRDVITRFYSIYAESKLKDIDDILRHFENRESDLFRTLEVKYDVTFNTDGACVPNNGDRLGEPFMDASMIGGASPSTASSSKFAVDVQSRTLKERLTKQGQTQETVNVVLSSGSAMM